MAALPTSLSNLKTSGGTPTLYKIVERRKPRCVRHTHTPGLVNAFSSVVQNSSCPEWALIRQAIAGDPHSRERLFAAHNARLYRTAFAILRNKEDAEDAVQDGLCSAHIHLRSFQGRSSFSTWLTRIVINSALMIRRKKYSRLESSLNEMLEDEEGRLIRAIVDIRPNPEEICGVIEIDALLAEEVRKLPVSLRKSLELRGINGLSTAESSRILGIRRGAFKSRFLRARQRLTRAFAASRNSPKIRKDPATCRGSNPAGCSRVRASLASEL